MLSARQANKLDKMVDRDLRDDDGRQGPLKPAAEIGEVRVVDPPNETLVMTPEEADVSAIRLMDAADKARRGLTDPDLLKDE